LQIRERVQGPGHPEVAFPLNNLAELYREQSKDAEAEPLYLRALHIWEQTLGVDHPFVAHPLNGLANLYRGQGRSMEAEAFYHHALSIREQQLGPHHPETLHDLALLRQKQGSLSEACSFAERVRGSGAGLPLSARTMTEGDWW
jgi:tetratricopeptide (TPR) repeat protein